MNVLIFHRVFLLFFFLGCMSFWQCYSQTLPSQPSDGPGGSSYWHSAATMHTFGEGVSQFWIFEPKQPAPDSADVVVFIHGLGQINPYVHAGWIKHLVMRGNLVIYPRYQTGDLNEPDSLFNQQVFTAIKAAFDTLQGGNYVKPRMHHVAVAGHSYGGLLTANYAMLFSEYNLPEPKCLLVAQPYNDDNNTVRLPEYFSFPDIPLLIVNGQNDAIVGQTFGRFLMDSSVNVNLQHKNLVTMISDNHGSPGIEADHSDPISLLAEFDTGERNALIFGTIFTAETNAADYYGYWKLLDALMECTLYQVNCNVAFGNTPEQKFMGVWSDGTPVTQLQVEPSNTGMFSQFSRKPIVSVLNNCVSVINAEDCKFNLYTLTGSLVYEYYIKENQFIKNIDAHLSPSHFIVEIISKDLVFRFLIMN